MAYETITVKTDIRGVAYLYLNRPDKHHALNAQMIAELHEAIENLADNAEVHLVILGSEGPHFCAGGDLRWMQEQMTADRATKMAEAGKLSAMLTALDNMPKPVIGRVQGNAYGGGLGLICACDIAVGVEGASFALSETRLGLIPATIGPIVFRKLGWGHTRQIFMTGSKINHKRALQLGLLSFAVPTDILDITIEKEISHALKAGPNAMAAAKALLRGFSQQNDWQEQNDLAINALADCWETQETQEGISAFFNKRPPSWMKD
ncbi:MAG: putative enoyl-CoA hydratase echA8 [Rhodospirillaceae bacterium]|mgnify:FL=1|jgi:methylglutaconyl-CoA hydratase|nr:MAG: putative enoyl-CoA hydratase echA8 [Rhodospirillaceae bacterium]